jgi:hypothetical protein
MLAGKSRPSVRLYKLAADQGYASAQFNLGHMYSDRRGAPQDDAAALNWYRKAADQGNASAQFNLGHMYSDRRGAPQDDAAALNWYRKAADQGNTFARAALERRGGQQQQEEQERQTEAAGRERQRRHEEQEFQQRADQQRQREACERERQGRQTFMPARNDACTPQLPYEEERQGGSLPTLGRAAENLPSRRERAPFKDALAAYYSGDYVTAMLLLRPLADRGDAEAQFNLGVMYANGRGVPQDDWAAASWYRKAADQGNALAQNNLGNEYATASSSRERLCEPLTGGRPLPSNRACHLG